MYNRTESADWISCFLCMTSALQVNVLENCLKNSRKVTEQKYRVTSVMVRDEFNDA